MNERDRGASGGLGAGVAIVALTLTACALGHRGRVDSGRSDAPGAARDGALVLGDGANDAIAEVPTCAPGTIECAGVCVDPQTSADHCGGCEQTCNYDHASATCAAGVCAFAACDTGYNNCDFDLTNGCETNGRCVYASCRVVPVGLGSGAYWLNSGGTEWQTYCDLESDGGGWTLILKADGMVTTFVYSSAYWTDQRTLNETSTDLDRVEAKFRGFFTQPVSEVRVVMWDPTDLMTRSGIIPLVTPQTSMLPVFTGARIDTTLGRAFWRGLLGTTSMQPNCNREGFNVQPEPATNIGSRVRIGIIANNENDCGSPNSRVGVGGEGQTGCTTAAVSSNSVGNVANCSSLDNGELDRRAFAYVFVR